jgi:hypothetical protein
MPYSLVFSPLALARLLNLPPEVRPFLPGHCERLRRNPVTLSFPGAPPASLPNRMLYAFPVDLDDGRQFTVRIHFQYGQDETTLHVLNVTAIQHS